MKNIIELCNGEVAAIKIVEIISIPTLQNIKDDFRIDDNIEEIYRKAFISLLSEVHQSYRISLNEQENTEIAIESLWITEKVENQPFQAKIRLFFVIRSIAIDEKKAIYTVERVYNSINANLTLHKYKVREIEHTELMSILSSVKMNSIRNIVKEERIDLLQNAIMPYCFTFDTLNIATRDLSNIVSTLIEHPNCAVSIQLIPTKYTYEEETTITQHSQTLDTLSKGIMSPGTGNISFSAAEFAATRYKYYLTNKSSALFECNILVYGSDEAAEDIATNYCGYANHDDGSSVLLKNVRLNETSINVVKNFFALPWITKEYIQSNDRNNNILSENEFQYLYRVPFIYTAEEASVYFRLPIGSTKVSAGLPIDESQNISKTYRDNIINAGDIEVGRLKSSINDSVGISLCDLAKHMLIVGTPGSGKTTFSVSLLDRLWKEHGIPFLVIEPAKNEYRSLVQSIPDLQIFTPGKNFISPFVYNPFVPPKNVRLETYKSTLKTAFAAGVSMTTPLDKIFEESINNCYSDFRWLDNYTVDNKGKIFNISDFIKCFQETFDAIGYTGDAKNIGRAGVVRLKSLINLFDNYYSTPVEDLLSKPTIIELAAIENSDQKALIISLLLLSILAYVNANYVGEGGLRNVVLLEEAHVLLDANINAGQGEANPSMIAQGLVKRMLAEIRSYGVGLIIADQSPRKVSTDVVALTDMKMVFRLVEASDKQIIADSMNMTEAQEKRLARLRPGEAFIFFNRLDEAEEIITPDYRLENNINITLSDDSIKELSTYWKDRKGLLKPYPECSLVKYCKDSCDYERRLLGREIARRIFIRYFNSNENSFDPILKTFGNISNLVQDELNDEPFTPELLACVKCQLWRKIKYETKIPIKGSQIENSLRK